MNKPYVILGSHSGIARALCEALAHRGHDLILVARSPQELDLQAADLRTRFGIAVHPIVADANAVERISALPQACLAASDQDLPEGVILCWGTMFAQQEAEMDCAKIRSLFDINLTSAAIVLQGFANLMAKGKGGTIVGISSVAGDRGRGSNYLYGATKAGLSALLDGMRHRYQGTGLHVLTVKPGFVATPMTHGLVNPESPLCARPAQVAKDILKAIHHRKPTLYTLWPWRWIMALIRALPEAVFLKTKL
ncbi:MAG: SDR family NAD(P)-dependent oxidoreductase [Verrucomicrobiota bacterium]